MENPAPARPFQFLVGLLGLPKYGTIDPTRLMALFLPFFFGIMLGDIGYGVLLATLSFFAHRRFRDRSDVVRDLAVVLMMSAGLISALSAGLSGAGATTTICLPSLPPYANSTPIPVILADKVVNFFTAGIRIDLTTGFKTNIYTEDNI